jgi:pimeloyl-ACP methyl ester carboxylesterase
MTGGRTVRALLVHGMGRTSWSMAGLGRALRRAGIEPQYFGYLSAVERFDRIRDRLAARIEAIATDEYVAIGHSLGGLLLRSALTRLPAAVPLPRHLVMLGTPHRSPRLARRFQRRLWYRWLNGDVGQLLATPERIAAIPFPSVPAITIAGVGGPTGRWSLFGDDPNDGIVALDETRDDEAGDLLSFPVLHPWMMNDRRVRTALLERISGSGPAASPR